MTHHGDAVRLPRVTRETDIDDEYERLRAAGNNADYEDDLWEGARPLVTKVLQGLMGDMEVRHVGRERICL